MTNLKPFNNYGQPLQSILVEKTSLPEIKPAIELFFFDMDGIFSYNIFYPHNNVENVLKVITNKNIKKKSKRKTIKLLAKI